VCRALDTVLDVSDSGSEADGPREAGRHVAKSRLPAPLSFVPRRWLAIATAVIVVLTVAVVWFATSGSSEPGQDRAANTSGTSAGSNASGGPATAPSAGRSAQSLSPQKVDECTDSMLRNLSLEDRVGQIVMIGTPVANPQDALKTIIRYRIGGVFLAGRSSASAAELKQAISQLGVAGRESNGIALHFGVDQEGGKVQTLSGADFPTIPNAVTQGGWDQATLRDKTTDWAKRLRDIGITIDLAPVADTVPTDVGDANPPIGALDRQFGANPTEVADDIATVVQAAQAAGILTTLKHFPGLGRVRANTDTSANARDDTATTSDPFLQPFAKGISAGTAAVMISSALYPKLDPNNIAAFSTPIITGLLREQMGFTGLVMSDDLGAAKAVTSVPVGDRAVRFIRAGGDLVLTVRLGDAGPMTDALIATAKSSTAFAARVAEAAGRVLRSKLKAGLLHCR
jgi:beta-N-acetylhexosaminidase